MRSGKSIDEVSMLTGIGIGMMSSYENDIAIPKRKAVHSIARVIGASSFWLLRWRNIALNERRVSGASRKYREQPSRFRGGTSEKD